MTAPDLDDLIERLQRRPYGAMDDDQCRSQAAAALVQLREERDALAKDAGRYRWLREQQGIRNANLCWLGRRETLDAAIDAAKEKP